MLAPARQSRRSGKKNGMLREIAHFVRHAPAVMKLQKELPRAEFADALNEQANGQGFARIRTELVEGLAGRVLEVGCGTGSMFEFYPRAVEHLEGIEPEQDFLALSVAKAEKSNGRIHASQGDGMSLQSVTARCKTSRMTRSGVTRSIRL